MTKTIPYLWCCVLLLTGCLLSGCDNRQSTNGNEAFLSEDQTVDQTGQDAETARMVLRLKTLREQVDPMQHAFRSEDRLNLLKKASQDAPITLKLAWQLAFEQMLAGYSAQAGNAFETLLQQNAHRPALADPITRRHLKSLAAIAYMRMGEQANCVMLHGAQSCLFPINPAAIHENQLGSERAMRLYAEILSDYPDDMTSRWLYNLAAQTLGLPVSELPEDWQIPLNLFASDVELPPFINKATATNSAITDLAGSVVAEDFNGDGLLDLMVSAWGERSQLRVLINQGDDGFVDHTASSGLSGLFGGLNIVPADYDNDGDVDVLVLRGAWLKHAGRQPNSLLNNDGTGRFQDVTERAGLLSFHPTQTAAWGDFDNDGWLDLYIGNESRPNDQHLGELYRNLGNGRFENIAAAAGLATDGFVKGAVWGDYDNDGLLDLYVSNMNGANQLFKNLSEHGQWRFVDVAESAGVADPRFSFPTWFWDYNNDGWLDIFVADFAPNAFNRPQALSASESQAVDVINCYLGSCDSPTKPRLYENLKNGQFADVTQSVGLNQPLLAMGANFGDVDNDGFLDVYIGNGAPDFRTLIPNRMFRNNAGTAFQDITTTAGVGHLQKGHGIAFADFDNDGDQDIYAVMGGAYTGDVYQNALFMNPGHGNHWLTIRLQGTESNRSAIGARVTLNINDNGTERQIHRLISSGSSFGANSLQLEVGLGQARQITTLQVQWPGGKIQQWSNIPVDQFIEIIEGNDQYEGFTPPMANF